ncbi:hypothetical protein VPDG_00043 [Vibrio phage henriette 12B8]|uniref:DNA primase n=1 Tax=Vibrio phage henriette 12B8 TaxID=573174 RepID=UPI0002C10E0A|nr:DNA primase [Vibrio phage henriette 12B8]AGG58204.1 hypothetical protein VPDG_00043 [Vibrio phage henriette 12B8]
MEFSYFNYFYDNKPKRCDVIDWGEFADHMRAVSEVEGFKPPAGDFESKSSGLISPAIYAEDGVGRSNDNVVGWDMVCMDIDDGVKDINQVLNHFKQFKYIVYSSPNCTKHKLKLRVCIPLDKRAGKNVLKQIWFAMNEWCGGIIDQQTKDYSRLFYLPARYRNRGAEYTHFFLENDGITLDWETLISRYPSPPEKDLFKIKDPLLGLKRKIFQNAKGIPSMNITDPNCPFVKSWMREKYALTPLGSHHRAIYIFMLQCCHNAEAIEYPLSHEELVDMGRQLDDLDGGYYDDKKLQDSAKDALEFCNLL